MREPLGSRKMSQTLRGVIATREFSARRAGKAVRVIVRIGKPYPRSTGEWDCPFEVRGLGRTRVRKCLGVDAFQALQLVPQAVRVELQKAKGQVTWYGADLEQVLPRSVPTIEPGLARRINRLIDRELARFLRVARRRFKARQKRGT